MYHEADKWNDGDYVPVNAYINWEREMMSKIDLSNKDKAAVLKALYDNARPQGLGFLHYDPEPMDLKEAQELLKKQHYFDYLKGRVMKVDLSKDELDPWLYDRDNGDNAAQQAIDAISG